MMIKSYEIEVKYLIKQILQIEKQTIIIITKLSVKKVRKKQQITATFAIKQS